VSLKKVLLSVIALLHTSLSTVKFDITEESGCLMSEKETVATDATSATNDPITDLKTTGNAEYAKGNYTSAIASFSAAIDIIKSRLIALDEAALALIASSGGAAELTEEQTQQRELAVVSRTEQKVLAATLFCNRSMCFSGLNDWSACIDDAKMVSQIYEGDLLCRHGILSVLMFLLLCISCFY
jgi:hypothetical protein